MNTLKVINIYVAARFFFYTFFMLALLENLSLCLDFRGIKREYTYLIILFETVYL